MLLREEFFMFREKTIQDFKMQACKWVIYWYSQGQVWFLFVVWLFYTIFTLAGKKFSFPFLPWCISWPLHCLFIFIPLKPLVTGHGCRDRWMDALTADSRCLHGLWSSHSIKPTCHFGIKIHCPLSRGCIGREFSMFIFCFALQSI